MQVRNNELIVTRGETFTLSKLIENRDGSPYIISSRLNNPYWRITIASSHYEQNDRYVLNKWLELKNLPRFEITQPVNIRSLRPDFAIFDMTTLPSGYEGDETSGYANRAIFYGKDYDGVIKYKYWEYINNEIGDFSGRWVDYKCPIITTFDTEITSQWIGESYVYNILLVDGASTSDYLHNIAENLGLITENVSDEEIYNNIFNLEPQLLSGVDLTKPLMNVDTLYPILESTKIYVKSNLKGVNL